MALTLFGKNQSDGQHPDKHELPSHGAMWAAFIFLFLVADYTFKLVSGTFAWDWCIHAIWNAFSGAATSVSNAVGGAGNGVVVPPVKVEPWRIFLQPMPLLVLGTFLVYDYLDDWRLLLRCYLLPWGHKAYFGDDTSNAFTPQGSTPTIPQFKPAFIAGWGFLGLGTLLLLGACGALTGSAEHLAGTLLVLAIGFGLFAVLFCFNEPTVEKVEPPSTSNALTGTEISNFVRKMPPLPFPALYAVEPTVYVVQFDYLSGQQTIREGGGKKIVRPRKSDWHVFVANRTVLGKESLDSSGPLLDSNWRAFFSIQIPDPAQLDAHLPDLSMPNVLELPEIRSVLDKLQDVFSREIENSANPAYLEIQAKHQKVQIYLDDIKLDIQNAGKAFESQLLAFDQRLQGEQEKWLKAAKTRGKISPADHQIQISEVDALSQAALVEINSRNITFDEREPKRMVDSLLSCPELTKLKTTIPPLPFGSLPRTAYGSTLLVRWFDSTREVLSLDFQLTDLKINKTIANCLEAMAQDLVHLGITIAEEKKRIIADVVSHAETSKANLKGQVDSYNKQWEFDEDMRRRKVEEEENLRRQKVEEEAKERQAEHDRLIAAENDKNEKERIESEKAKIEGDLTNEKERIENQKLKNEGDLANERKRIENEKRKTEGELLNEEKRIANELEGKQLETSAKIFSVLTQSRADPEIVEKAINTFGIKPKSLPSSNVQGSAPEITALLNGISDTEQRRFVVGELYNSYGDFWYQRDTKTLTIAILKLQTEYLENH